MTSDRIARDYLRRAACRRQALDALLASGLHADVVREIGLTLFSGLLSATPPDLPALTRDCHSGLGRLHDRTGNLALAIEDRAEARARDEAMGVADGLVDSEPVSR